MSESDRMNSDEIPIDRYFLFEDKCIVVRFVMFCRLLLV